MTYFSVNMAHVRQMPVNADNVSRIETLLANGGQFTTIDDVSAQTWRDFFADNNVFYTETMPVSEQRRLLMKRDEKYAWAEYDMVCNHYAKHDKMPDMVGSDTMELINEDTDAFMDRVNCTKYALAQEKVMSPEDQRRFIDVLQMAEDAGYFDECKR